MPANCLVRIQEQRALRKNSLSAWERHNSSPAHWNLTHSSRTSSNVTGFKAIPNSLHYPTRRYAYISSDHFLCVSLAILEIFFPECNPKAEMRLRYLSTESHAQQRLLNGDELQFQRLISPGFHSQTKLKVLPLPCQSFLSFYEQKKAVLPYFTIPRHEAVQREHAQISLQVSFRF